MPRTRTFLGVAVSDDTRRRAATMQKVLGSVADVKWVEAANIISNGPYIMKEWKHDQIQAFEINPNYWGPKPIITRAECLIYDQTTYLQKGLAAYENNEQDTALVAAADYDRVKANATLSKELKAYAGSSTQMIHFDCTNKPTDNAKVRTALYLGYDRKALVRLICNSQTYQRSMQTDRFNATDETLNPNFIGPQRPEFSIPGAEQTREAQYRAQQKAMQEAERETARAAWRAGDPTEQRRTLLTYYGDCLAWSPLVRQRLDLYLRVQCWRLLNASHRHGVARENDGADALTLVHVGTGAILATDDKRVLSAVVASGSSHGAWVRGLAEVLSQPLPTCAPWEPGADDVRARFLRSTIDVGELANVMWPTDL